MNRQQKCVLTLAMLSLPLAAPVSVMAQGVLEEIVVTAQRREQSLQEVPISIETYGGLEISRQGYRDMQELSLYSPTVTVEPDILRNSITIRGLGAASADALTIEQSSPTFVDGIHYGRTSQIKLAFLDVQSVEVLKGPQPVYFGQNAIAGAFNLTTRKPTPEWEGNLNAEISNFDTQKVEFGAGGPINDSWGIRVAGMFERSDGYLEDIVTNDKFPSFKNYGGRIILEYSPSENFKATWKLESSDQKKGAEGKHVCLVDNPPELLLTNTAATHEPQYVLLDPPYGVGWDVEHKPLGPCFGSNDGILVSGALPPPRVLPPLHIAENGNTILLNVNGLEGLIPRISGADGFRQDNDPFSYEPHENINPWNTYLNLSYTLDGGGFFDGVELTSLTGYDYYYREYVRDNRGTPFWANFQNRMEDQYSLSQEFRATSPTGGTFEWMVGLYYQEVDYDFYSDSVRPNNRTGRRYNEGWEDAEWKSVFGNITWNFLDNKASIDLGARYSNSSKQTFIQSWGAQWIMFDGFVFPWNQRSGPDSSNTVTANCGGISCRAAFALYNGSTPIGMTDLVTLPQNNIPGPYLGEADQTELNPQIVLRYRPTDSISMYAKYAESFKAAGFNTGQATLPPSFDEYSFGPEYGTNYELGIKGDLFGGSARYTISLFQNKITDLQLAAATPSTDNNLLDFQNAGAQRVRGSEFTFDWAATDQLTLNLSGAILDGVMLDYTGATCTEAEFANPQASGCDTSVSNGAIDRSGTQAPNTPDWKFVLSVDYVMPLSNGYEASFNAKGYVSDGYITDTNGFSQVTKYNQHEDLGINIGFGPQEGSWKLTAFARNLLEASPSYNAEFDLTPEAILSPVVYRSSYTSYGLSFRYNYE